MKFLASRSARIASALYIVLAVIVYVLVSVLSDPKAEVGSEVAFLYTGLPWSLVALTVIPESSGAVVAAVSFGVCAVINALLVGLVVGRISARNKSGK